MDERVLQIDHRVPYEVGGDDKSETLNPDDFMLLSGSANRAKSWSCEHYLYPFHLTKFWHHRLWSRSYLGLLRSRRSSTLPVGCRRMERFLGDKDGLEIFGEEDLKRFLSYIAMEEVVAACTQWQALNAGVFFLREVRKMSRSQRPKNRGQKPAASD